MALGPDGRVVLTAAATGSPGLWDAATGKPIGPAMEHPDVLVGVAFADEGKAWRPLASGAPSGSGTRRRHADRPARDGGPLREESNNGDRRALVAQPGGRLVAGVGNFLTLWPAPSPPTRRTTDSSARPPAGRDGLRRPGGSRPIDPARWQDERRARDASTLADPPMTEAEWHDRVAALCEARGPGWAAIWHLDHLIPLRPGDWTPFAPPLRAHSGSATPPSPAPTNPAPWPWGRPIGSGIGSATRIARRARRPRRRSPRPPPPPAAGPRRARSSRARAAGPRPSRNMPRPSTWRPRP